MCFFFFLIGECSAHYTELGPMKDPKVNRNMTLLQEPSLPSGSKRISDKQIRLKIGDTCRFSQCGV